jgi:hypothetical protein
MGAKEVSAGGQRPSNEKGGSGLRSEAGGDGQEALQRGLLCAGRSAGGGSVSVLVELIKELEAVEEN